MNWAENFSNLPNAKKMTQIDKRKKKKEPNQFLWFDLILFGICYICRPS